MMSNRCGVFFLGIIFCAVFDMFGVQSTHIDLGDVPPWMISLVPSRVFLSDVQSQQALEPTEQAISIQRFLTSLQNSVKAYVEGVEKHKQQIEQQYEARLQFVPRVIQSYSTPLPLATMSEREQSIIRHATGDVVLRELTSFLNEAEKRFVTGMKGDHGSKILEAQQIIRDKQNYKCYQCDVWALRAIIAVCATFFYAIRPWILHSLYNMPSLVSSPYTMLTQREEAFAALGVFGVAATTYYLLRPAEPKLTSKYFQEKLKRKATSKS